MYRHTRTPWNAVQLLSEDASEYVSNAAIGGTTGFYAVQARKSDGKLYDICHTGNGPDSQQNALHIAKCVNGWDDLERSLLKAERYIDWLEGLLVESTKDKEEGDVY